MIFFMKYLKRFLFQRERTNGLCRERVREASIPGLPFQPVHKTVQRGGMDIAGYELPALNI